MRRRWLPLVAVAGVAATVALPIAAQPASALPSTHEITANWYGTPTPTTAPYGAAITSEWHINTNDDGDPYTNQPVDNVRATLTVANGVFVTIPAVCETEDVTPVSEISPDGTTLLCNVGTVNEGTATVIQAPVRVSGVGVDIDLTASGTVTSDEAVAPGGPASPPPLPITYTHGMDLSLFQAPGDSYQGTVKESRTGGNRTFLKMNFSLVLSAGSMPGPSSYSFPVTVSTSVPGMLNGFQWESCGPVSPSSPSTGQPFSDPDQLDRTNFPGCTVTPNSGTNYTVSLSGLTYDLINTPTNDSMGQPLSGTGAYIASGTVEFSFASPITQLTGFTFTAAPPPFTFLDNQVFPDANAANNTSSATVRPPGGFSNHWAGNPANSRSTWDANLFVSPGTSQGVPLPTPGINTIDDYYAAIEAGTPPLILPLYMQVNSTVWQGYTGPGGDQMAGVCTMSENPDFIITSMDGGGWIPGYENYETARFFYTTAVLDTKTETCGQASPGPMWTEVTVPAGKSLTDPRIASDILMPLPAGVTAVKMTWNPAVDTTGFTFLRAFGYIDPTAPTTGEGWTVGTFNYPGPNPYPGYPTFNGYTNISTWPDGVTIPGSTYGPNTNGARDAFRLQGAQGIITKTTPQTTAEPGVPITYTLTAEAELAITSPPNQSFPVVDTLPEGLEYVPGSADPAPASVSADGRVITWQFTNVPANQEFEIEYQAVRPLDSVLTPGSALTNVAEIQVPADQRPAGVRQARETVVVPSSSSTNLMKTLEDEALSFYGDDSAWLLTVGSQDPINNTFTDTIDILPYVGDGRGTNVSGTTPYTITGVTAPAGSTVYYTTADPETLSLDPRDPTNGATPGTVPAGTPAGWTTTVPATNPTAIRVIGPALAPGATQQIRIGFTTPAGTDCLTPVAGENRPDEVLVNSAGSFAGHTALPMLSSAVATIGGCVVFDKGFESLTRLADGTYDVRYTLTAEGEGNAVQPYDLIDDMQYGDAITINELPAPPTATFVPEDPGQTPVTVLNTWDPTATTLVVANDVPIADEEVQVFSVLVNVSVDGAEVTWENTNCSLEGNETGTGLRNTATLTNPDVTIPDIACPEVPFVEHTKTLTDGPTPIGNGLYEVEYTLEVRNLGAGADAYDLTDDFRFGEAVSIVGTPSVVNTDNGGSTVNVLGTWDPAATALAVVVDQPILGGTAQGPTIQRFVVTVQVAVDAPMVTFANTDCEMGNESGTGLFNESTLTVDEHVTNDDECAEISEPLHTKTVSAGPTPVGGGLYEVEYTIQVSNAGAADAVYDLVDDFKFGQAIAIVGTPTAVNTVPGSIATSGTWDPATTTLGIVDDEGIASGDDSEPTVHEYVVTVQVSVDNATITDAAADCTMAADESGTGLFNTATLGYNGESADADDCVEPPVTRFDKTLVSVVPNGDGTYSVTYELAVSRSHNDGAPYRLTDTLRYGAGTTVNSATITGTTPAGLVTNAGWNGASDPLVADDVDIAVGETHVYRIVVNASIDEASVPDGASDCTFGGGENGTGFTNTAAVTTNGATIEDTTCDEFPVVTISKDITSGPTALGNGQQQVTYTITVRNQGQGDGSYNLTDTLTYGGGVTIVSTSISNATPGGIATNPAWDGTGNVAVASGVPIAAGATHTYTAVITVTVASGITSEQGDCTLAGGEGGTGLLNTAQVDSNGETAGDAACTQALAVVVPPAPPAPTAPPAEPPTGELPATGGNNEMTARLAAGLLAMGAIALFVTRRRRRVMTS